VGTSSQEPSECRLVFGLALQTNVDLEMDLPAMPGPPDLQCNVRIVPDLTAPSGNLVYASSGQGPDADVTAYQEPDHTVVRFRGADQFHIYGDRIECELLSSDYFYLVRIQLLGHIMSLWMELRGHPVLHASVVEMNGQGVAFLGGKTSGKTALAAAALRAGSPILSDDLAPLDISDDRVVVRPTYPQLRLEPDAAAHFIEGWEELPLVHPSFEKRRVPVSVLGDHQTQPATLSCIYLPDRDDPTADVEILPLSGSDALVECLKGSFLPEMVAGFGLEQQRLHKLATLVRTVAIKRLRYPAGFDRLTQVVAAVGKDLR
jgi:hypothetical protein